MVKITILEDKNRIKEDIKNKRSKNRVASYVKHIKENNPDKYEEFKRIIDRQRR